MLARERHGAILEQLGAAGAVRVAELAQTLRVAEETIRRDLEKLGREGLLLRTHGGAVRLQEETRDQPFEVRRTANHAAKVAIARRAAELISEGDVIALDASSTVHELTRFIPDVPLTVVTYSLLACVRLLNRRHVRVIATGGVLDHGSCSWLGALAETALERLNINRFFLSSKGVDLERGLSEVDDAQARIKRRLIDAAEQAWLLADSSKFGVRSAVNFAAAAEMDRIITDPGLRPDLAEAYRSAGLRLEVD